MVYPGFWRLSNISTEIYECNPLGDSCLGGQNSTCKEGYEGLICSVCLVNKTDTYFKSSGASCLNCKESESSIILVGVILFAYTVYLVITINLIVNESLELADANEEEVQDKS